MFKHAIICSIMIKYAGLQSITDVKCYSRRNFNVTQYTVVLLQYNIYIYIYIYIYMYIYIYIYIYILTTYVIIYCNRVD